jgi:hypothetical protein
MKLQLKRSLKTITNSTLAQAPSVDQMEYGEIAVNYVSSDPSLFLKDSTNVIRKMQLGILPDLDVSTEQSGTLDDRYILNTGDTLTGNLSAPSFIGGVTRMSAVAPAAGEDGELWWNNNDGRLYIYYNDGVTTQWVDASPDSFTLGAGYYDKNEADARYIAKAGGIMTGILQLAGNPATALAASPKQYVDSQATAAQTAAQDFATAAIASIPATDLSAYDTSVQVDAKIAAIPATDLSSYDTSAQVDAKIAANTPDLSNYSGNISTDGSATFSMVEADDTGGQFTSAYNFTSKSNSPNHGLFIGSTDSENASTSNSNASITGDGSAQFAGGEFAIAADGYLNGYATNNQNNGSVVDSAAGLFIGRSSGGVITSITYADGAAEFTGVTVKGDSVNPGSLELNCEANSHTVAIKAPAHSAAANYTLTLPPNAGNSGQTLTTDGTGSLTWSTPTATADLTNYDTSTEVDAKITSAALSLSSLPALP